MTVTVDAATGQSPTARKVLIGVQAAFWGCYFIGVGLLLTVAAVKNGGLTFWPFAEGDMRDPKDVLGLGIPGYILHIPLATVTLLGAVPAAVAGLIGIGMLIADKAHRTLPLIISSVLAIAFAAAQLTPFGRLVQAWMLD